MHAEAWLLHIQGLTQWGLDTAGDSFATIVSLLADGRVLVYNGFIQVDSGLTNAPGAWSKYEINYVVKAAEITLTVNGNSAVMEVPAQGVVKGLWFDTGAGGTVGYVDDVLARSGVEILFADNFEADTDQLELSWMPFGFALQENDNVSNSAGWTNVVGGASSPKVLQFGGGNKFFRLKTQ